MRKLKLPKARRLVPPCVLCPNERKQPGTHGHHLRPVEYGGSADGRLLRLCPTCHGQVHAYEKQAAKVGSGFVLDLPSDPPWRQVVGILLKQKAEFQARGVPAQDARRRVGASLTDDELKMAHFVKRATGASSLDEMVKTLIKSAYKKITTGA